MDTGSETGPGTGPGTGLGGAKHRNEHSFTVENNPRGKKKVLPEVEDGLDDVQRMRLVWGQPSSADCNTPQRHLRKMLEKDRAGYFKIMTGLEKVQDGVGSESSSGPESLPSDEGEERVRRLRLSLLGEVGRRYEAARRAGGLPPS